MARFKGIPVEDSPRRGGRFGGIPVDDAGEQEAEPGSGLTIADVVKDTGVSLLGGVLDVGQTIDRVASALPLVSVARALGLAERPDWRQAHKEVEALYSDPYKANLREVEKADGFVDTVKAALERPSVIYQSAMKSAPGMFAGGLFGRGLASGLGVAPWLAGGIGEGVMSAGSAANQIENESGVPLTDWQRLMVMASGVGTAALGAAGGKIAGKLKLPDIETMMASGKITPTGAIRGIGGAMLSEGVFEELPQSMQEQVWQNLAQGKPWNEGVGAAGAMGLLTGAAMGGAGGGYNAAMSVLQRGDSGPDAPESTPPAGRVEPTVPAASQPTEAAPPQPRSPAAAPPTDSGVPPADLAADPDARLAQLELLASQRELTPAEQTEAAAIMSRQQEDGDGADGNLPGTDSEPAGGGTADARAGVATGMGDGGRRADVDAANGAAGAPGAPVRARPGEDAGAVTPAAPTWFGFLKEKGLAPASIRKNTPQWRVLRDEFDQRTAALKRAQASVAPADSEPSPAAPAGGEQITLQNRDRARQASIDQMRGIARDPDYMRLGPSRSPDTGAPMVFAVGNDTSAIAPDAFGREDVAVMSDGQRVPFRYAVIDASRVEPSNFVDGRENPAFGQNVPGLVKALNNGRTAGLRAAWQQGAAARYLEELAADTAAHGVLEAVIRATPNPTLVRIYSETSNTADMAARSQGQGLGMSPAEIARQDAALIDGEVLGAYRSGDVAAAENRDFVRAFVGRLAHAGQDVAGLMDRDGALSSLGRQRLQAALAQAAYGDTDLVQEMFDNLDSDIKAIGEAMKIAAVPWANMRDSARSGAISAELDVTPNLLEALRAVRKARHDKTSLHAMLNQPDLLTGQPFDPMTARLLRFFYSGEYLTRPVGQQRLAEILSDYAQAAMQLGRQRDLLTGKTVTAREIVETILAGGEHGRQAEQAQAAASEREPAGGSPAGGDPGQARTAARRPADAGRGDGPGADRGAEQPAGDSTAEGREEGRLTPGDFSLTQQTEGDVRRQEAERRRAEAQRQKEAEEQARRGAAPPADDFVLSGSERAADQAAARGQMELGGEASVDAAAAQAATSPKNDLPEPTGQRDSRGLTAADRYAQKIDSAASELAGQIVEETKDGDYDGLLATIKRWAKDAKVAADDLRAAVLKALDKIDAPVKQKNAIRLALNPARMVALFSRSDQTRQRVARPEVTDPPVVGARDDIRSWVRKTAEMLRAYADALTGPENPSSPGKVIHSGSAAGPSSYFHIGRAEVRVSTHSKGPARYGDSIQVFDRASAEKVLDIIELGAADFAEARKAGRNVWFSRRAWRADFPDAMLGHRQGVAQAHPDYVAAKAGDDRAALRLARDLVTDEYVAAIRGALPVDARPTVVPVLAVEAAGNNRIPLAVAKVLGDKLGLPVATNIVQARKVSRGGSDGFHRLANPPNFTGPVVAGDYLILDDTLTQGGTLAQLKTHIEDNGGRVLLASALTGKAYSARIALSNERLTQLRERYGSIEPWWRDTFGYGFDGLTESEARFILSLRDRPGSDTLRDRVVAARVRGVGGVDGRDDSDGRDQPPVASRRATEPATAPYETDLFGNTLPAPPRRAQAARPDRAGLPGDVQPAAAVQDTEAPAGDYFVRTIVGVTSHRRLGANRILTPGDAARATRYLYRSAVERFDGIVTDAAGKPLAVIGGFKGALTQTAVYPATLVGEAVRIPGAARIWFSHNHPSGKAELSAADRMLHQTVADVFRGSGIEPMGLLAVAGDRFAYQSAEPGGDATAHEPIPASDSAAEGARKGRKIAAPSPDGVTVPVIEREIAPDSDVSGHVISAPSDAIDIGRVFYDRAKAPGLMLVNAQHRVIGWVPLPTNTMGDLRNTGGLHAIYRAVSESNAAGAVLVHGGEPALSQTVGGRQVTVAQNIGAALDKIDARLLDSVDVVRRESAASRGAGLSAGPVYARGQSAQPGGLPVRRVTAIAAAISRAWTNPPEVVVIADMQDARVPQRVRDYDAEQRSQGAGEPEGFFLDGKVYLVASQMATPADVVRVLAHEALGHYGLRGLFGGELGKILDQIAAVRRVEVEAKRTAYGLPDTAAGRRVAAEEVLAGMAQTNPQLGFVRRAVAAIRTWLRGLGLNLRMTDDEIIRSFILPARAWVQSGAGRPSGAAAFSRGEGGTPEQFRATERAYGGREAWQRARDAGRTKLSYGQWVTVRTPAFKAWFGDWEALRAQQRLDAMEPIEVPIPGVWAEFTPKQLRAEVGRVLDAMVKSSESIAHPELGEIRVNRTGERKTISEGRDPAKLLVAADLRNVVPASIWAATESVTGHPSIVGYAKLLSRVRVGGVDLVAVISVREQSDGRWYYNAVTVQDQKNQAPDETGAGTAGPVRGALPMAEGLPLLTAIESFVRRPLVRVNPDTISKVVDENGEPLVVYHGTDVDADFTEFDTMDVGSWFAESPSTSENYANRGRRGPPRTVPAYLSIRRPLVIPSQVDLSEETRLGYALDLINEANGTDFRPSTFWESNWDTDEDTDGAGWLFFATPEFVEAAKSAGFDGMFAYERGARTWDAFSPEQIKSATGNTGAFDPGNPDIRFSRTTLGDTTQPTPTPTNNWQRAKQRAAVLIAPDKVDRLLYEFQDRFIDLKRIREHITALGKTISDLSDAYLGEELYHKRVAYRTKAFLNDEIKPLMAHLRTAGVTIAEFESYLHARHAQEANRVLAERNPNQETLDRRRDEAASAVRELELDLQRAEAAGTATKAIRDALDQARAEQAKWQRAQAFRGSEQDRLALSGMSDADAQALLDGLPPGKRQHLEALAARVDAINAKTLDALERYGLMDKAALDTWRATYRFYVPLHRDDAHPDSVTHPIGQGFSVRGDASKARTGSTATVTHILGHIAMQREAAITRGEKNAVAKRLYLMVAQNPDPDLWSLDKPKRTYYDQETGTVMHGVAPDYRNRPNVVMVRIAGRDHAIVFNEHNPRAVRLAAALKNLDMGDLHGAIAVTAKGTRWIASVNTQYNPLFGVKNTVRDLSFGLLALSTTPIAGKQIAVARGVAPAMRAIYRDLRSKEAQNTEWSRLWREMQETGGTTGYRDLFRDPQERAKALERELAALDRGEASKAAHAVVDWLSDYNETMENAVRLSAYKVALDSGMSKERAASLAKNLTVNFNRKGRLTRELGAMYAFFNASLQGSTRVIETLRGPAGKRIMLGGVLLGVFNTLLGMAVMGGGDDDEWEKIPDFVKERDIIIPISRKDYLTIPMPLGFHILPNLGRLAVEAVLGRDVPPGRQVGNLLLTIADAFNPLGSSQDVAQLVSPTVLDPAVSLLENRDWTGRPIYREDLSSLDPTPGHQRTKDTASAPSKAIARALSKITGGTEYRPGAISWTPDQIDYVIGQVTGGVGRELLKASQVASTLLGAEADDLPAHKIPLTSIFYGNVRGVSGQSERYYENIREINEIENELRGRQRAGQDVEAILYSEPLVQLIGSGKASQERIRLLRDRRRATTAEKAPGYRTEVREINEQIGETMADLNREARALRRGATAP